MVSPALGLIPTTSENEREIPMILRCNSDKCKQPQSQDDLHGLRNRVMNQTKDPAVFRCTVCSEKTIVEKKGGEVPMVQKAKKVA